MLPRRSSTLLLLALTVACGDNPAQPETVLTDDATASLLSPVTVCNPTRITMLDGPPNSNPFPSTVTVSGVGSAPYRVTATIHGATHIFLSDMRVILKAPGATGAKVILLSGAGGQGDFLNSSITFDDAAPTLIPALIGNAVVPNGAYKPSNFAGVTGNVHPGTPPGPYGSLLAVFTGTNLDGVWQLYAWDAIAGFTGNIGGGWCLTLEPLNSAPIANAGGPYAADEGAIVAFDGTASQDPDTNIASYAWDLGDGATGTGETPSHTYADNGTFTVSLVVTDDSGSTSSAITNAVIQNVAPALGAITGIPAGPIVAGTVLSLQADFTDAGSADTHTGTVTWGADPAEAAAITQGAGTGTVSASRALAAGTHTVSFTVTDDDGGSASVATDVTVIAANALPVANAGGPYAATEGAAVAFDGSGSADADNDIASYAWDFGDGATGSGVMAQHIYADNGTYVVTLVVTDDDGAISTANASAVIDNVAPVLGPISGLPAGPVPAGTVVTATATFTDAGTADTHTGTVTWNSADPPEAASIGVGTVTVSRALSAGTYNVTLTVTDDDGASASVSGTVQVNSPPTTDQGSVAGTGAFKSPAGALAGNPSVLGTAGFVFGAKTTTNGTLAAHLEFILRAGSFHFRSTEDESLVITGDQARYQGQGTVNGAGAYGFLVTAIDGGTAGSGWLRFTANDKIRVRIWELATGVVIYDNQPGASEDSGAASSLSVGAIVILNH